MHGEQSNRYLHAANGQVQRHLPAALARVLKAQHQHGEAVKHEAPQHAEGVGFAERIDIAAADEDGDELQPHHHVQDAVAGAELGVRPAKPISQHAIFGDAVEHAVGAHNRRVYRAGEHQEADDHDKRAEDQLQRMRPCQIHGQHAQQVGEGLRRAPHVVWNQHHAE